MFFLFVNQSLQFFVKHLNEDLYISDDFSKPLGRQVIASDKSNRMDFVSDHLNNGLLVVKPVGGSAVWDIGNYWTFTYHSRHAKPNQLFSLDLIAPKTYLIKNRDKCIEYMPNEKKYLLNECTNVDNQKFKVFTAEEEEAEEKELMEQISNASFEDMTGSNFDPMEDLVSQERLQVVRADSKTIAEHKKRSHGLRNLRSRKIHY